MSDDTAIFRTLALITIAIMMVFTFVVLTDIRSSLRAEENDLHQIALHSAQAA